MNQPAADFKFDRIPFPFPYDPIPWWVLDKDKIEQIIAVQIDTRITVMESQIAQLRKIHKIVGG